MLKNKIIRFLLKTIAFYIVFLLFCNAKIIADISPFSVPLLFVLVYLMPNEITCLPAYFLAQTTINFSITGVIIAFCTVSFACLAGVLAKRTKKPIRQIILLISSILGQLAFCFLSGLPAINIFISLLLSTILLYIYSISMSAILSRGWQTKFTIDEGLGLAGLVMPVIIGLQDVAIKGVSIQSIIVAFSLLMLCFIKGGIYVYLFSVSCGIGVLFCTGNLTALGVFCVWAVAVSTCGRKNKFLSAFVLLLTDFLLGFFFNAYLEYSWLNFLSVSLGASIFLIFRKKQLNRFFEYFSSDQICFSNSYLIDQNAIILKRKLKNVSNIFYQMNNIYKKLVIGEMDAGEVRVVLAEDVAAKCCSNCERCKNCYKTVDSIIKKQIEDMFEAGLMKGKISLVDVPAGLTTCIRINQIMNQVNQNIIQFRQYQGLINREDKNKILVGNQFWGAGQIIESLANNLATGKRSEARVEKSLIDEFLFSNIIVRECLIVENDKGLERAVVIIKDSNYTVDEVLAVTNSFFKIKTVITSNIFTDVYGWRSITINRAPRYDVVVGAATIGKNGQKIVGDKHSFVALGDNRFLIGVSDGKGSGKRAEQTSETTIGLIENFYRAGYNSQLILQNVNRILAFKNEENFSALDLCIVDCDSAGVDFVKVGSSPSVIKRKEKSEIIFSDSLPIGILENAQQTMSKLFLSSGDVVVLASDGVYDSFGNENDFVGYINNTRLINMKMLSDSILEEAIYRNNGKIKDDMTVVCFRLVINR